MNWYYSDGDKAIGPLAEITMMELRACGMLAGDTLVRREGTETWLEYVEAFFGTPGDYGISTDASATTQQGKKDPASGHKLPQSIKSLASNKQASAVLADLRSMDFKAEIAPIDLNILALIKKDI
jgi:hypothetical protein